MDQNEIEAIVGFLDQELHPYRSTSERHLHIPVKGVDRREVLAEVRDLASGEDPRWRDGGASGAVYCGDQEHIDFLNEVYALTSQMNPLHPDLWPSAIKFEAEIVAMTAAMLGGDAGGGAGAGSGACGTVSSGGTESILLAVRAYRDQAREQRGIEKPNMVVPASAHAAFDKAAAYFGVEIRRTPCSGDMRADVDAARAALDASTILLAGSAPSFPHGVIDPIEDLSELAAGAGVGFHTDACLGGFILPWAEKLGYDVAPFDLRLPGVTSISADTHKFGYAAKGTSVLLYRSPELRRYQYFVTAGWMGGLYYSPTFAGSRPGALSAECWAAMLTFGEDGYMDATSRILSTARTIREGIESIGGLRVLGDPLWVIAFSASEMDVYRVMDEMSGRGWSLNGLQDPPAVHICVTLRHCEPGVAERFLADLSESVSAARSGSRAPGTMTPIYGMAGAVETRGDVEELLRRYGDVMYRA